MNEGQSSARTRRASLDPPARAGARTRLLDASIASSLAPSGRLVIAFLLLNKTIVLQAARQPRVPQQQHAPAGPAGAAAAVRPRLVTRGNTVDHSGPKAALNALPDEKSLPANEEDELRAAGIYVEHV